MMASIVVIDCQKCAHKNVCRYSAGISSVKQSLSYVTDLLEAEPFSFHVKCPDYMPKKEGGEE